MDHGRAYVWRGPKENQHRPAINALFRSAAVSYERRVIGVILSGALEDGATGLWWIKQHGGITIVQDPKDAEFPTMPAVAIATVQPDYVVAAAAIPDLLVQLVIPDGRPSTPSTSRY
jgi:two-component system chemotaxis response regulator CheB